LERIFKCAGIYVKNILKSDERNGVYGVKQKILGGTYEVHCFHMWIDEKEL
jgi:hypothetical protein